MRSLLHKSGLYFNSLRYLRWEQIFYRFLYRFKKIKLQDPGALSTRTWPESWKAPSYQMSSLVEPKKVIFLGEPGLIRESADWNAEHKPKLWLYNLHYFDDLNARDFGLRTAWHTELVKQWINENHPMNGNGWEPYPISIRLVNWVKWLSRRDATDAKIEKEEIIQSMGLQSDALLQQLEYHILGNHLFANAKALVFAGTFLEGEQTDIWLNKGLCILDHEIAEQFLPDGGHFELSPMYHASLLWDICDLINLAQCSSIRSLELRVNQWVEILERGLVWLKKMTHPDGHIAFFNDAAFNVAPEYVDLEFYAQQLRNRKIKTNTINRSNQPFYTWMWSSGYCRVEMGEENVALLDLACIGPDYLPGHAHADTLSFELSLFGQRVFVNTGTSRYGVDEERHRQRSTAAHNTVVVNGQNSSQVWSGFRVAKRAYPTKPEFFYSNNCLNVSSSHSGFSKFASRCIHKRMWSFRVNSLTVTDRIEGKFLQAEAYFHIHPSVQAIEVEHGVIRLYMETSQIINIRFEGAKIVALNSSNWHPEFGKSEPNSRIKVVFLENQLTTHISW